MASWFKVAEFPGEAQLEALDRYLHQHSVLHRFTEEGSKQVLWLQDPSQIQRVKEFFEAPQPVQETAATHGSRSRGLTFNSALGLFPFTLLTIALGLVGYIYQGFLFNPRFEHLFSFMPLSQAISTGHLWRLLTPTYLHFSGLHLLFNGLWIWELGRRIEVFAGKKHYILLFFFSAIGANYIQYFMGLGKPYVLFGGLSGVVYAYLGYLLLWHRFSNNPLVQLPAGIFIFMLVWLALGFTGIIDIFISGSIANGAHLGGLLSGMAYAALQIYFRPDSYRSTGDS